MEIEFRSDLNDKIIEVVGKKGLTHSDVARLAHTSRTRVTAIYSFCPGFTQVAHKFRETFE
jgi:hypothetical protein